LKVYEAVAEIGHQPMENARITSEVSNYQTENLMIFKRIVWINYLLNPFGKIWNYSINQGFDFIS